MGELKKSNRDICEGLTDIYLMYFDEARGHVPLFIYPEEKFSDLVNNKTFMRPIKYHPIWFLTVDEQEALDHIDLEFKGYTFFGKKFFTKSKRKKKRAGLDEETPETIIIIISLPNEVEIFGDDLIRLLTKRIIDHFGDKLYELIEYEDVKEEVIKTPRIKEIITEGEKIKKRLENLISTTCGQYFSSVIKETDTSSIKQQKALSYLALKGVDVSHLASGQNESAFSNIKLFDPSARKKEALKLNVPFNISGIDIIGDSHELEIIVQNTTEDKIRDVVVKITHVKEFFEKEIMSQLVDEWFPQEELVFLSPITPQVNEYLFFIIDNETEKRLLSQKIDINMLTK
jgi:hypothetical protein